MSVRTYLRSVAGARQPRRARGNAAREAREAGSVCCSGPQAARQPGGQCAAPASPPSQSEADQLRPARRSAGTGAYMKYVRMPSTARREITGTQQDRKQVLSVPTFLRVITTADAAGILLLQGCGLFPAEPAPSVASLAARI